MTDTATREKRRHRSPNGPGLFVTDQELIELLGIPERDARVVISDLDRNPASGFPKKSKIFAGRRYLPAVRAYFDNLYGIGATGSEKPNARRQKRA